MKFLDALLLPTGKEVRGLDTRSAVTVGQGVPLDVPDPWTENVVVQEEMNHTTKWLRSESEKEIVDGGRRAARGERVLLNTRGDEYQRFFEHHCATVSDPVSRKVDKYCQNLESAVLLSGCTRSPVQRINEYGRIS